MTETALGGRPCRDCDAPMVWARWKDSGKGIPLDPEPNAEKGNLVLADDGTVEQLKGLELEAARLRGDELYVTHFFTCPNADTFRKGR